MQPSPGFGGGDSGRSSPTSSAAVGPCIRLPPSTPFHQHRHARQLFDGLALVGCRSRRVGDDDGWQWVGGGCTRMRQQRHHATPSGDGCSA